MIQSMATQLYDCVLKYTFKTLLLTNVDYIYIHRVRGGLAHGVGGDHSDVVVDPDGCIILVKEAGVLTGSVVIRALIHFIRAAGEAGEQHVITHE